MVTAFPSPPPLSTTTSLAERQDVVVVGAGIIGLACAAYLQEAGRQVLVIDSKGVAEGASKANAGGLALSDILPLASPRTLRQVPRWFFDPLGPLSLPIGYLPRMLPWLLRFVYASRPAQVTRSIAALADLMALSRAENPKLWALAGAEGKLRPTGSLQLYDGAGSFRRAAASWEIRKAHGIAFEHLQNNDLHRFQPGLSSAFHHGTHVPGWEMVSDPYEVTLLLAGAIQERGAVLAKAQAMTVKPGPDGARLDLANGKGLTAAQVVLAAGAWSRPLAKGLGDRIPLETERGYNTTLENPGIILERQLIFGDHGFVVSPLSSGLRVGGGDELAGLDAPPNYARARAMLTKAKGFLPDLNMEGGIEWMGHRPSLPDSLPVIGHSAATSRVVYAFGHAHLGLTQAAATARLVRDLIAGTPAPVDLAPLRPGRF